MPFSVPRFASTRPVVVEAEEGQDLEITFLGEGHIKVGVDREQMDPQAAYYSSVKNTWMVFSGIFTPRR
jgi:hypothetical protein